MEVSIYYECIIILLLCVKLEMSNISLWSKCIDRFFGLSITQVCMDCTLTKRVELLTTRLS